MKKIKTKLMGNFPKGILPFMFIWNICLNAQAPAAPEGLSATGYERHVTLQWTPVPDATVSSYQIFRSEDGGQNYNLLKSVGGNTSKLAVDWTGDEGLNLQRSYKIKAVKNNGVLSNFSNEAAALTHAMDDEALMDMVQEATFRYFWDYGHPVSGMARERSNGDGNTVTTGGSGFGIMAIIVGVERGWITRQQAVNRMIQIVSFLQYANRFHGVFPHWMNGTTGVVQPFSQYDDGADLVETAFLMQGLLAARSYYAENTPEEAAIRDAITGLWEDVEWDWFRRNGGQVLYWHWSPNYAWTMNFPLRGFFEAQIVYILAAASPTHPVPGSLYGTGWASGAYVNSASFFGHPVYCGYGAGGPMFFAHYSYMGFDPRNWKDFCCNYYVRNRNCALIQWEYAQANPENHPGYGADCWGLTACDGPWGYSAHDILPANDEGTIAPTAALASMPYTPDESMAALRHFYRDLGENLWGPYGFYDAFNEGANWFASSYLAIDQGPIVGMIENHRTRLFWDLFMQNTEIEPALLACGFVPDASVSVQEFPLDVENLMVYPNPVPGNHFTLQFDLKEAAELNFYLSDALGKRVRLLENKKPCPTGKNEILFSAEGLPKGPYFLSLEDNEKHRIQTILVHINRL